MSCSFDISQDAQAGKKSREQLEKEKKAIMKQRIVPLNADGLDQSGLTEKAKELYKLMYRLESEKYDLEKRYKQQQVDVSRDFITLSTLIQHITIRRHGMSSRRQKLHLPLWYI